VLVLVCLVRVVFAMPWLHGVPARQHEQQHGEQAEREVELEYAVQRTYEPITR
jgi:hypothetical protein